MPAMKTCLRLLVMLRQKHHHRRILLQRYTHYQSNSIEENPSPHWIAGKRPRSNSIARNLGSRLASRYVTEKDIASTTNVSTDEPDFQNSILSGVARDS